MLALAVLLSVFQIWQGVTSTIYAAYFRPAHLTWVVVLIFLHYPLIKNSGNKQEGSPIMVTGRLVDLGFCALALFAGYQIIQFDYNDINYLLFGLANTDLLAGVVFTLLLPCLY
ncbi:MULTISPECIES: hypothetical protein [unclassified Endozoicomonas]|uniref:hypothetical protein n=1 Tax=unclassified Endozoicomonas TaxID=2644528 RepID=UPI003BB5E539